jgi:uncharacterized protein DUF6894
MARYYFSLEDGHPIGDPIGENLPDEKTALAAAQKLRPIWLATTVTLATSALWSETTRIGGWAKSP